MPPRSATTAAAAPAPMPRERHLRRGFCCRSGCMLCPWDFSGRGNAPIDEGERQRYGLGPDGERPGAREAFDPWA